MPKECVECGEDPSSVTFLRKIIISPPPPQPLTPKGHHTENCDSNFKKILPCTYSLYHDLQKFQIFKTIS